MTEEKRDNVIRGLEYHFLIEMAQCEKCPYYCKESCTDKLAKAAIALLKAQEPVKPKWEKGYAYCGKCGYKLHWIVDLNNFCPNCGQAVKWE